MKDKDTHEIQPKETRAIINIAIMMLEYGAESILVEQTAQRFGKAFGIDSVEVAMLPSAIVVTTLYINHSFTTTRRVHKKPINMSIICDIGNILTKTEDESKDVNFVLKELQKIKTSRYNGWLVAFMVGVACASFSHLQGGDERTFIVTFIAAFVAMVVRREIIKRQFIETIAFGATAFVATLIASGADLISSETSHIALASSVLLLFPGFPFINALLDSLKGYLSMGWGRLLQATLLTVSATIGIIMAMYILNLKSW